MPKLTDTQLVILNAAAARDSRSVLPLPKSLKVNKGTAASVLATRAWLKNGEQMAPVRWPVLSVLVGPRNLRETPPGARVL